MTPNEYESTPVLPATRPAGFFDAGDLTGSGTPQDRLRDLEARYRGLIDRLPAVIYIDGVGDGDTMVDVSRSMQDMLGISRDEWLSTSAVAPDRHPDDLERVIAASEAVEGRHALPRRVPRHASRRPVVWIREDSMLVRGDDDEPCFWLGLMLDITETIQTQHQLMETQTKYGALVEQIPAIVYVDIADEDMTTTYVSPQIEELLGYTPQEYVGDPDLWGTCCIRTTATRRWLPTCGAASRASRSSSSTG